MATEKSADAVQRLLRIGGIQTLMVEPLAASAPPADAAAAPRGKTLEPGVKPAETVRVDIGRLDQLMDLAGQLVIGKARVTQIAERLKKVVANGASARTLSAVTAELEKMAEGAAAAAGGVTLRAEMEDLRTTARQLHKDLDGVHRDLESLAQARTCVNDLFETVHLLDRVSDGIHQSVMDTRMLPVGPLFARFHRVIRDITRANGKDIRLVISGEKTELDKRMIDELADPMIHLIRNAADHGIESPEVRAAAGKPRQGTISLDACHRGSNIVIRVSDDGQGLNHERIRAKAVEKGLISAADAERMTPQQIYQLIWLPGLSTAEKLTEVSGRGVGMDIVRSTIDELNGTTEIESEPGRGTTLTIKLPLTLAILPSLMVEIGGDVFALPLESVVEIVDVRRRDMATVCGCPTVPIRDRVVSILTLGTIFQWRHRQREDGKRGSRNDHAGDHQRRKPATGAGRGPCPRRRGRSDQVYRRQLSQRGRHRGRQYSGRWPRLPDSRSARTNRNVVSLYCCRGRRLGGYPMTDVSCLETTKLSLLREFFASATHDASAAMCCWTNSLITLTLDEVCEIPLQNVCADLNLGDEPLTMVVFNLDGGTGGAMILTFTEESARRLAASLARNRSAGRPGLERIGAVGADRDGKHPRLRLRERHHPLDRSSGGAVTAALCGGLWGQRAPAGAAGPGGRHGHRADRPHAFSTQGCRVELVAAVHSHYGLAYGNGTRLASNALTSGNDRREMGRTTWFTALPKTWRRKCPSGWGRRSSPTNRPDSRRSSALASPSRSTRRSCNWACSVTWCCRTATATSRPRPSSPIPPCPTCSR